MRADVDADFRRDGIVGIKAGQADHVCVANAVRAGCKNGIDVGVRRIGVHVVMIARGWRKREFDGAVHFPSLGIFRKWMFLVLR